MKLLKTLRAFCLGLFVACIAMGAWAASSADSSKDPSLQQMRNENERIKLENEKLKLQVEREKLKAKKAALSKPAKAVSKEEGEREPIVVSSPKKYIGMEIGRIRSEAAEESRSKAEDIKDDAARVVLDFTNGELWYKGVRSSMDDFKELVKREGWKSRKTLEKRNAHGYARERRAYKNISSSKYEMKSKGTFTWIASDEEGAFGFDTPEGVSSESTYDEFRNQFESAYFTYEKSKTKNGLDWLYFKHRVNFKSWSEKLQFGFNGEGKLMRVDWGLLDEN